jgi:SSS family solute:Na+ symporter
MANSFGGVYAGLVSKAIIAAIWSTGPALLLIISTTLTRDFYKVFKPDVSDAQQVRFSKIAVVIVAAIFTIFGLNAGSILNQMLGAFQIRSVVGIVLAVALFWPRVTKNAAFWSMLLGGIVAAVWHFSGSPFGVAPLWPAALVCLVILIPMSLASKEKVSPGYKMYKEALEAAKAKGEL